MPPKANFAHCLKSKLGWKKMAHKKNFQKRGKICLRRHFLPSKESNWKNWMVWFLRCVLTRCRSLCGATLGSAVPKSGFCDWWDCKWFRWLSGLRAWMVLKIIDWRSCDWQRNWVNWVDWIESVDGREIEWMNWVNWVRLNIRQKQIQNKNDTVMVVKLNEWIAWIEWDWTSARNELRTEMTRWWSQDWAIEWLKMTPWKAPCHPPKSMNSITY